MRHPGFSLQTDSTQKPIQGVCEGKSPGEPAPKSQIQNGVQGEDRKLNENVQHSSYASAGLPHPAKTTTSKKNNKRKLPKGKRRDAGVFRG